MLKQKNKQTKSRKPESASSALETLGCLQMPECSSFPARSSELGVVYNRGWESSLKETALFP